MSKATSKFQVTIPKQVADQYGIKPGDDIEWVPTAETIRVVPRRGARPTLSMEERIAFFDAATERQRAPDQQRPGALITDQGRGWTRQDLYTPGQSG